MEEKRGFFSAAAATAAAVIIVHLQTEVRRVYGDLHAEVTSHESRARGKG